MDELVASIVSRVPPDVWGGIAAVRNLAFIVGPAAVGLLALYRHTRGQGRPVTVIEATFLILLSITTAAVAGAASFVHGFTEVGRTGTGGLGRLIPIVVGTAEPMLYALIAVAACLVVVGGLTLNGRDGTLAAERPPMSRRAGIGWSALMGLAVSGAERLVTTHHELMGLLVIVVDPARVAAGQYVAEGLGHRSGVLLFGGAILTLVIPAAALAVGRASRTRSPHPALIWSARVALVVALAGALWHARVVNTNLNAFHDTIISVVNDR